MKELLLVDEDLTFSIEATNVLRKLNNTKVVHKSTLESTNSYLKNNEPEIILFSTDLMEIDSKLILTEEFNSDVPFIFFSEEFCSKTYQNLKEYNFLAYMIKPFHMYSMYSIIESYLNRKNEQNEQDVFYFRKKGKLIPISKKDIQYIYTDGNYCVINHEGTEHTVRYPLGKLIKDLNYQNIVRSHRRYAININMIDELDISNNQCLVNGIEVPIGRLYKKDLKKMFSSSNVN